MSQSLYWKVNPESCLSPLLPLLHLRGPPFSLPSAPPQKTPIIPERPPHPASCYLRILICSPRVKAGTEQPPCKDPPLSCFVTQAWHPTIAASNPLLCPVFAFVQGELPGQRKTGWQDLLWVAIFKGITLSRHWDSKCF